MHTWVEYWKYKDERNNTHAQMKENAHWVDPNDSEIMRRYFDDPKDARPFAKRLHEQGYITKIKTD